MYRNILKINIIMISPKVNFCFKDYTMGLSIIIIIITIIIIIIMIIIIIIINLFFLLHYMNELHCRFSLFHGGLVIYCAVLGDLHL